MVGILEEAGCEDDVEREQLVVQWGGLGLSVMLEVR